MRFSAAWTSHCFLLRCIVHFLSLHQRFSSCSKGCDIGRASNLDFSGNWWQMRELEEISQEGPENLWLVYFSPPCRCHIFFFGRIPDSSSPYNLFGWVAKRCWWESHLQWNGSVWEIILVLKFLIWNVDLLAIPRPRMIETQITSPCVTNKHWQKSLWIPCRKMAPNTVKQNQWINAT